MTYTPGYVVVGHLSKDLPSSGGVTGGGTVLYAGITAALLGVPTALVTACAPADLALLAPAEAAGVLCAVQPSPATTTFSMEYRSEARQLYLHARATPLGAAALPAAWQATPILHLGPIADEVDAAAAWDEVCPNALIGVTPQGWLRAWDAAGRITATPWTAAAPLLARTDVLVMSLEDTAGDQEALLGYVALAPLAVVTAGGAGATLYEWGQAVAVVPACQATPVDFTGAGDVFAAAFLVRYHETGDALRAIAFAHAAAAYAIEAPGIAGITARPAVTARAGGA
ncbi:MAG: PfkB family carbohydrate kinase [Chloroflexota bacterium]|nr:PfkB family carbohydrate kinase [Chloroflexota bacterium]